MQGTDPRQAERMMKEGDASVPQEAPDGPRFVFRVAGVVEGAGDVGNVDLSGPYGIASAEFYARYRDAIAQFGPVVEVRLRNGFADVPELRAEVARLAGGSEFVSVEDNTIEVSSVNDAVDTQALALILFAVITAAAGLAAVGTAVTRQLAASGGRQSGPVGPRTHPVAADRRLCHRGLPGDRRGSGVGPSRRSGSLASPSHGSGRASRAEPRSGLRRRRPPDRRRGPRARPRQHHRRLGVACQPNRRGR